MGFNSGFKELILGNTECLGKCYRSTVKVKTIPLQAWTGPEGSKRLRVPDFKKIDT